jgi:hypothetical protein
MVVQVEPEQPICYKPAQHKLTVVAVAVRLPARKARVAPVVVALEPNQPQLVSLEQRTLAAAAAVSRTTFRPARVVAAS